MIHKQLLFLLILTSKIYCLDNSEKADSESMWSFINDINILERELTKDNHELIYKKLNNCFRLVLIHCNKEQQQKVRQYTNSIMTKIKKFQKEEIRQLEYTLERTICNREIKINLASIESDQDFQEDKKETLDEIITNNFLDYLYSIKVELEDFLYLADFVKSNDFIKFKAQMEKNRLDNLLDDSFGLSHLKVIFMPLDINKLLEEYEQRRQIFVNEMNSTKATREQILILNFNVKKIRSLITEISSLIKQAVRANFWMEKVEFNSGINK